MTKGPPDASPAVETAARKASRPETSGNLEKLKIRKRVSACPGPGLSPATEKPPGAHFLTLTKPYRICAAMSRQNMNNSWQQERVSQSAKIPCHPGRRPAPAGRRAGTQGGALGPGSRLSRPLSRASVRDDGIWGIHPRSLPGQTLSQECSTHLDLPHQPAQRNRLPPASIVREPVQPQHLMDTRK